MDCDATIDRCRVPKKPAKVGQDSNRPSSCLDNDEVSKTNTVIEQKYVHLTYTEFGEEGEKSVLLRE